MSGRLVAIDVTSSEYHCAPNPYQSCRDRPNSGGSDLGVAWPSLRLVVASLLISVTAERRSLKRAERRHGRFRRSRSVSKWNLEIATWSARKSSWRGARVKVSSPGAPAIQDGQVIRLAFCMTLLIAGSSPALRASLISKHSPAARDSNLTTSGRSMGKLGFLPEIDDTAMPVIEFDTAGVLAGGRSHGRAHGAQTHR